MPPPLPLGGFLLLSQMCFDISLDDGRGRGGGGGGSCFTTSQLERPKRGDVPPFFACPVLDAAIEGQQLVLPNFAINLSFGRLPLSASSHHQLFVPRTKSGFRDDHFHANQGQMFVNARATERKKAPTATVASRTPLT